MSLDAARALFAEAFRLDEAKVREDVVEGRDHSALISVFVESGIPDRFTYPQFAHQWDRIEKKLSKVYGFDVFFESINAGESRLYRVIPLADVPPPH